MQHCCVWCWTQAASTRGCMGLWSKVRLSFSGPSIAGGVSHLYSDFFSPVLGPAPRISSVHIYRRNDQYSHLYKTSLECTHLAWVMTGFFLDIPCCKHVFLTLLLFYTDISKNMHFSEPSSKNYFMTNWEVFKSLAKTGQWLGLALLRETSGWLNTGISVRGVS